MLTQSTSQSLPWADKKSAFKYTCSRDHYVNNFQVNNVSSYGAIQTDFERNGIRVRGRDLLHATEVYRGFAHMGSLDNVKAGYTMWLFEQHAAVAAAKGSDKVPYHSDGGRRGGRN